MLLARRPGPRELLSLVLTFSLAPAQLDGGDRELSRRGDWSRVSALRTGRRVTVVPQKGQGNKVSGAYVSADADSITLRTKDGQPQTILRPQIRKVTAERERTRYAPLIGMLAGAAFMGILVGSDPGDIVPSGVALYAGVGAGIGLLVGLLVRSLGRSELVYEAQAP